jgi:TfoX/Sxy family transcriptional regulator of competence genes
MVNIMSYDEGLAQRLRELLSERSDIVEKKMFGGLAFMLSGNMCCGVIGDTLMARVGEGQYQNSLKQPYVREMDFTGKPLKGFVYVASQGIESDQDLESWVSYCINFSSSLPPK